MFQINIRVNANSQSTSDSFIHQRKKEVQTIMGLFEKKKKFASIAPPPLLNQSLN